MKIEVLYPEVCCLFGDQMNITYLCQSLPEAEIVKTPLKATPAFTTGDVDMVYLCSMTEHSQALVIDALRPYKDKIAGLIDGGTIFLVTGNALEVFISRIENEDGSFVDALGLFELTAKRRMMNRHNSLYLGKFGDLDIVGYKSQFSHAYGNDGDGLFTTVRGIGRNPGVNPEGIRKNNFMATYLLGPLLVLNPLFSKYLLKLLGAPERSLAYEKTAMEAYALRLMEFTDPKRDFGDISPAKPH